MNIQTIKHTQTQRQQHAYKQTHTNNQIQNKQAHTKQTKQKQRHIKTHKNNTIKTIYSYIYHKTNRNKHNNDIIDIYV